MLKYVWFVQDYTSMVIDCVYTTKKAAFTEARKYDPHGVFHKLSQDLYYYKPRDKYADPHCAVERVAVIHNQRKLKGQENE